MSPDTPLSAADLSALFPQPLIRGARISRQDLRRVQGFRLDAETAGKLGRHHIGILAADCRPLAQFLPAFGRLAAAHSPARFAVVPFSYVEQSHLLHLGKDARYPEMQCLSPDAVWSCGSCLFAMPERLSILSEIALEHGWQIGAVMVWDPLLQLHQQRRLMKPVRRRADIRKRDCRPPCEAICQLRYDHRRGDWRPPLLLCTNRQLRSIDSQSVSRRYGLQACWYVDGETIRCGELNAGSDPAEPGTRHLHPCGHL